MARRPKAAQDSRNHSFSESSAYSDGFKKREPGYPLITRNRKAVNIDWTSKDQERWYRGKVPAEGYDANNPSVSVTVPNWDVTIETPTTEIPQTSYTPTINILSPSTGSNVTGGTTINITVEATEYPYYVALYVNNTFVEQKAVSAAERGNQTMSFTFSYYVDVSLVGTELIIFVVVKGVSSTDGFVIWKPASTGTTDTGNSAKWDSLGTTTFYDQAQHGYDIITAPDFLLGRPQGTSSIRLQVI